MKRVHFLVSIVQWTSTKTVHEQKEYYSQQARRALGTSPTAVSPRMDRGITFSGISYAYSSKRGQAITGRGWLILAQVQSCDQPFRAQPNSARLLNKDGYFHNSATLLPQFCLPHPELVRKMCTNKNFWINKTGFSMYSDKGSGYKKVINKWIRNYLLLGNKVYLEFLGRKAVGFVIR